MSSVVKNILTMSAIEGTILKSKIKGCLLGGLIGDCLGAPYEGDTISSGDKVIIQRYFDKLEHEEFVGPHRVYTDDTAMVKSVAKFLIDKPEPDFKFLAKLFVQEYIKEPKRGYGENVVEVFHKLKNTKYADIYKPAAEQFWGSGSYGNGGAMRIAPVALHFHDNYESMLNVATQSTRITHTNLLGINGALLQCIAIQQSLYCNPQNKIDPVQFCIELQNKMKQIEKDDEDDNIGSDPSMPYVDKLKIVEYLLKNDVHKDNDEDVIDTLGNGISAFDSVPTAIYCFLKAQQDINGIKTDNIFRRTIQYAVTLGGDTDTIACMAGSIAGAHLGEEGINKNLIEQCEFSKEMIELAENLFIAKEKST